MLARIIKRHLLTFLLTTMIATPSMASEIGELQESTYRTLDKIRNNTRDQLAAYVERMSLLAESAANDPAIHEYFRIKQRYWQLQRKTPAPPEAQQTIDSLKESMREHCLVNYQAFYDILFVDHSGFVLSSVRQQGEYHRNLFEGKLASTALSKNLKSGPQAAFVDYEFYWVSNEPSAFFVEPLMEGDKLLGWLVLQCAFNKINSIFLRGDDLGQTGEVFLVNRQHQMLTESRLRRGDINHGRKLSRENIAAKFAERQGHKRVTDYRGYAALTSFAVYSVLGGEWLIIAKIDEAEVITRLYREHAQELQPNLIRNIPSQINQNHTGSQFPRDLSLVDMDEFRFSRNEPLITFGVSTCTAIVITLPQKAVMGHASVNDRIYGSGEMDLLGNMLRHIRQFEVYPFQWRDLQVTVVAPHRNSLSGVLDQLMDYDFLLSQIRFIVGPHSSSATVLHDPATRQTVIKWTMGDQLEPRWQIASEFPGVDAAVKTLIGYE